APNLIGIENGNLGRVAWSRDGRTLFAAGGHWENDARSVFAWSNGGAGARHILPGGLDTVMSLVPLPGGDLLVAAADPLLARVGADGTTRWSHPAPKADFRNQRGSLSVSADGSVVDFAFLEWGKQGARFDMATRQLRLAPPADRRTAPPRQNGLPIRDWLDTTHPTLDGRPLQLYAYETSRSIAIHPKDDRFVLGADWFLRAFDAKGAPLWTRPTPGVAWAVNISGDGRLVVAAYNDGTIRWHRMSDGAELLAFMPLPDRTNWVAWTPEGFYAASAGAHGVLRWLVNRGWDAAAETVPIEDIAGSYRPTVLPLVLQELETPRAVGLAVMAELSHEIQIRTHSAVPPGARLHLLTIGISAYNPDYARTLRLHYADRDASDLASAITSTQGSLYAGGIREMVLLNQDANRAGILRALATMRSEMAASQPGDLAVVHFSGHGAMIDGRLYLLPYDVDARDPVAITDKGIAIDDLRARLLDLAQYGRVLVLLDACHAGATTMDGATLAMDSTKLRTGLAAANVTVLTSSSGLELSRENAQWQHGAFTRALLDAFDNPAADTDRNGLISTNGLAHFVVNDVETLTNGTQHPEMEIRFDTTVFASGE
ncbi:MAG TPA: caspase family protein, partial [Acetobacteraceae bacterium]|nr:caspase family protein [Acetobacteraceae bacterium]